MAKIYDSAVAMAQRADLRSYFNSFAFSKLVKYDPSKSLIALEEDVLKGFLYLFEKNSSESLLNALRSTKFRKQATKIPDPFTYKDIQHQSYKMSISVNFLDNKKHVSISVSAYDAPTQIRYILCGAKFDSNRQLPTELQQLREIILDVQKQYTELSE